VAGRLFTFGCSFTKYHWPTWADLLLTQIEGENWGKSGGGNKFIFESLIECMVSRNIDKDDTVIIMWTSFFREDRYMHGWQTTGNVYNSKPLYDKEFLFKYWDDKGAILNNLNFICGAIRVLESIGCKWKMAKMVPFTQCDEYKERHKFEPTFDDHISFISKYSGLWVDEELMRFNQTNLHQVPVVTWDGWLIDKQFKRSEGKLVDHHPLPYMHYLWAKKYLSWLPVNFNQIEVTAKYATDRLGIESAREGSYPNNNFNFQECRNITRI